jgi:hypothetical protein
MRHYLVAIATFAFAVFSFAQSDDPKTEEADDHLIAFVLGMNITAAEKDELNGIILGALLRHYAAEHKLEPTDDELDDFINRTEEAAKRQVIRMQAERSTLIEELKSGSLSDREREEKTSSLELIETILEITAETLEQERGNEEQMHLAERQLAYQFVVSWKINKSLYEKYGGRLIFQQAGIEPLDAYRDFLKEQEKKGAFQILDKQYEADFWRYFTNDAMHSFISEEEGAQFINTPWWIMDEPLEE